MYRTRNRPLPAGKLSPRNALIFSAVISLLSIPCFLLVSPLIAALGALAWLYYVMFYSMYLKTRTAQNIVVGGAAGAFPPLIGWVAVSGQIDLSAIFLFLIIFFWTPPHAYALMLVLKDDYQRAMVPMFPVVKGEPETVRQILIYSVILFFVTIIPVVMGLFGLIFFATALILGSVLIAMSIKLMMCMESKWAFRLYKYSTLQLALLFLGLVIDRSFIA